MTIPKSEGIGIGVVDLEPLRTVDIASVRSLPKEFPLRRNIAWIRAEWHVRSVVGRQQQVGRQALIEWFGIAIVVAVPIIGRITIHKDVDGAVGAIVIDLPRVPGPDDTGQ